jgi:hypothetical protein
LQFLHSLVHVASSGLKILRTLQNPIDALMSEEPALTDAELRQSTRSI